MGSGTAVHDIKRRTPDQHRVAVEHDNLDRNIAAGHNTLGRRLRRTRNLIAERNAFGLRKREGLRGIVGAQECACTIRPSRRRLA